MYFSFYSSLLFFLLVFLSILKPPKRCQNIYLLFFCLSTVSSIHHSRSYEYKTRDGIQFLDRSLVVFLAITLLYCFYNKISLYLIAIFVLIMYFIIIPRVKKPFFKSVYHSIMHLGCLLGFTFLLLN